MLKVIPVLYMVKALLPATMAVAMVQEPGGAIVGLRVGVLLGWGDGPEGGGVGAGVGTVIQPGS
jgi:hypothetical protein